MKGSVSSPHFCSASLEHFCKGRVLGISRRRLGREGFVVSPFTVHCSRCCFRPYHSRVVLDVCMPAMLSGGLALGTLLKCGGSQPPLASSVPCPAILSQLPNPRASSYPTCNMGRATGWVAGQAQWDDVAC